MKNRQKGTITIWLAALIVIIGLGAYISLNKGQSKGTPVSDSQSIKETGNVPANSDTANIVYKNAAYGYTLNLPQTWKDYKTTNQKTSDADTTLFSVKNYDNVFSITVFTKDQWKKILADDYPKPEVLGETGSLVFAARSNQNGTNQPTSSLKDEIKTILQSFKLN